MGKKKSKKPVPIKSSSAMKSRTLARKITTKFHQLTSKKHALKESDSEAISRIEEELIELGGRDAYQKASQLNTSIFSTSKWVWGKLSLTGKAFGRKVNASKPKERTPSKVLEIGAINTQLLDFTAKGLCETRAIDINSQSPRIEEANFLSADFEPGAQDAIVCSMVLNCVPNADLRGEMIKKIDRLMNVRGDVFVVVPLLCLTQSPHINKESYETIWKNLGYELREVRVTPKLHMIWGVKGKGGGNGDAAEEGDWRVGKGKMGGRNTFGINFSKDKESGDTKKEKEKKMKKSAKK
ncbi:hypothetical protein TL16_g02458, partial [Triparma laevis f. inornata]